LIGLRWRLARNRMRKLPGDLEVANGEADWFRAPFNVRIRGIQIPLFAVFGGLLTATAWVTVMALHTDVLVAGSIWMLAGLTTYVIYRRSQGLSLTETYKIELPPSAAVTPVSYTSVLVAFEENTFSDTAMATAVKLASHRRGDLNVLITLEVPHHLDLNADLGDEEAIAREIIETARQWAQRGQRVSGSVARVRPGQAGQRIVHEAIEGHADAIVMPLPPNGPPGRPLNKTLETVLRKRPARVVIDSKRAQPFDLDNLPGEVRSVSLMDRVAARA
jgi:basic amino acid/polyamine antiporter, APA family